MLGLGDKKCAASTLSVGLIGSSILLLFSLIAFFVLTSTHISASNTARASVTVSESCRLTTASGSGQTYNVSMLNGQYKNDIGKTRLSVLCNTKDSFAIYAVGYSDDTLGNNYMVTTGAGTNIPTGTATSGPTSAWAMKVEAVTGASSISGSTGYTPTILNPFNNFTEVPTVHAKVAEVASVSGYIHEAAIDASYAIYVAPSQSSGSYTGKVRYTVVHPASDAPLGPVVTTAGKIGYVPNASGVVDTMGDQEYIVKYTINGAGLENIPLSNNSETALWASNFQRLGYGFAGWNTAYDYSGTTYGPNETITTPSDLTTNGLTLYAVWVKSAGNMQNWQGCNGMSIGSVTALTDTRDQNTYAVAKLADGKCWMTENLRLGGNTPMPLDSTATDLPSGSIFTLSASQDPTITAWCNAEYDAICIDQSMLFSGNTTNTTAMMTNPDANVYSYGNYYNWYSATAGTGTYSLSSSNATGSICPNGWRLPTGGNNGEIRDLDIAMGGTGENQNGIEASNRWLSYPANYSLSGQFNYDGAPSFRGYNSGYSTSSASAAISNSFWSFALATGAVRPYWTTNNSGVKYTGRSIRCLAN